ncbi:MAG: hypothetical protein ACP5RX_00115 [Minisyncoccia bacterium]
MKSNIETFVQTIPYGRSLHTAKLKVNSKGEVVIIGREKTWSVKDIDAAIRQQLLHVTFHYEDLIIRWPKKVEHKGKIYQVEDTVDKVNSLLKANAILENSDLEISISNLKNNLEAVKFALTEQEKRDLSIVKKVLHRAEKLVQEKERCNLIIRNVILAIIEMINVLEKKDTSNIKWSEYFDVFKKLGTVYVNPYQEKTKLVIYRKLQYEIYDLVKKQNLEQAKKLLWQGLEKLLSLYPNTLTAHIGEKTIKIQNGIINLIR